MFDSFHPASVFLFITLATTSALLFAHPAFLIVTLVAAMCCAFLCKGFSGVKFGLGIALPAVLVFAVVNPLINHRGSTILFYIKYNAVTLESIMAGLCSGVLFASVMLWFAGFSKELTSERLLFLFDKISPSVALVISMSIRLVPRLKTQIIDISNAQKTIGRDISSGKLVRRSKNGLKILSALISWALENSIETADSMNARGYGKRGRSSFHLFSFKKRDFSFIAVLILSFAALLVFYAKGFAYFEFFPTIQMTAVLNVLPAVIIYAFFCFAPLIFNAAELIYWKLSK